MGILVNKINWNDEEVITALSDIEYEYDKTSFDHEENMDYYGFLVPALFGAGFYGDGGHDEYAIVKCEEELYVVTLVSYE